jgi:hypothetical protein
MKSTAECDKRKPFSTLRGVVPEAEAIRYAPAAKTLQEEAIHVYGI